MRETFCRVRNVLDSCFGRNDILVMAVMNW